MEKENEHITRLMGYSNHYRQLILGHVLQRNRNQISFFKRKRKLRIDTFRSDQRTYYGSNYFFSFRKIKRSKNLLSYDLFNFPICCMYPTDHV